METKIEKLKKILEIMKDDTITPTVLKEFLDFLLSFIKKEKEDLIESSSRILKENRVVLNVSLEEASKSLANIHEKNSQDQKKEFEVMIKKATELLETIKKIKSTRGVKGEKGDDGDPGRDGSPDSPEQVRDKLEILPKGEKLSISAIEDLSDLLEKIQKQFSSTSSDTGRKGYGVKLIRFIDDEPLVGTMNGVNTVFTISSKTPVPGSLKVYRNGARQRVTEDYTFNGNRTITFIIPPESGEVIFVDYRY